MTMWCKLRRNKSRLTISLSKDVLKKVDGLVDGKALRSRSHAIEDLLTQSLGEKINTGVILAGGPSKGRTPSLTKINGRSLISLSLSLLKKYGFTRIYLCAGRDEALVKKEIGGGSGLGTEVTFVKETSSLGTAGVLSKLAKLLSGKTFLVLHGDVLTDINLEDFVSFHQEEKNLATIAVKPRGSEKSYGKVMLQGNKITSFNEEGSGGINIVNTGIYLFEPEIFDFLPRKGFSTLEKDVFPKLARQGKLSAFLFQGIWFDISRKENLKEAERRWKLTGKEGNR